MPLQLIVNGNATNAINEGSHADLEFDLQDKNGDAIAAASITEAKLWLTVKGTDTVINSRSAVDVTTKFNAEGHFLFTLTPDDNVITSTTKPLRRETHLVTVKITVLDVTEKVFMEQMTFNVQNLEKIPEA